MRRKGGSIYTLEIPPLQCFLSNTMGLNDDSEEVMKAFLESVLLERERIALKARKMLKLNGSFLKTRLQIKI